MSKYRLKPVSPSMWVVQKKGWLFWHDCTDGMRKVEGGGIFGGDTYVFPTAYVHTIDEGKRFIEKCLDWERDYTIRSRQESAYLSKAQPIKYEDIAAPKPQGSAK